MYNEFIFLRKQVTTIRKLQRWLTQNIKWITKHASSNVKHCFARSYIWFGCVANVLAVYAFVSLPGGRTRARFKYGWLRWVRDLGVRMGVAAWKVRSSSAFCCIKGLMILLLKSWKGKQLSAGVVVVAEEGRRKARRAFFGLSLMSPCLWTVSLWVCCAGPLLSLLTRSFASSHCFSLQSLATSQNALWSCVVCSALSTR